MGRRVTKISSLDLRLPSESQAKRVKELLQGSEDFSSGLQATELVQGLLKMTKVLLNG